MKSERKINHGFWATPTDYQRLTEAAEKKRVALGLRKLPLGDYIMMMLDQKIAESNTKTRAV